MLLNRYEYVTIFILISNNINTWYLTIKNNDDETSALVKSICNSNTEAIIYSQYVGGNKFDISDEIIRLCKIKLKFKDPIYVERRTKNVY